MSKYLRKFPCEASICLSCVSLNDPLLGLDCAILSWVLKAKCLPGWSEGSRDHGNPRLALRSRQPLLQVINVLPEFAELTLLDDDSNKSGEGEDDLRMHLLAFWYLELSHSTDLHSCGVQWEGDFIVQNTEKQSQRKSQFAKRPSVKRVKVASISFLQQILSLHWTETTTFSRLPNTLQPLSRAARTILLSVHDQREAIFSATDDDDFCLLS
jgi:hypothetical protein